MGKASTSVGPFDEEALIEGGDGGLVHEEKGHLGIAAYALGLEYRSGQPRPALHVDRVVRLLVGGVDVKGHRPAPVRPRRS